MKRKLLIGLITLILLPVFCRAENDGFTSREVTGCENTNPSYELFYSSGQPGALIPGLSEGLVPQGLCFIEEKNWLLFAGYSGSGETGSALIAVDRSDGSIVKQVLLRTLSGEPYTGHAGGVCVSGDTIYVSNAHRLYTLPLQTFLSLPEKSECAFTGEIPVPVNASWCCCEGGMLYVGEFEYSTEYKTDKSHKMKTADGTFRAWTCCYRLDENGCLSSIRFASDGTAIPDLILATPERIQGMTVKNGSVYISQSYGRRSSSLIMRFDALFDRAYDCEIEYGGFAVPMWFLDKNARSASLLAPPMSESLCTVCGTVYVLFESAAGIYRSPGNLSSNPMDRVFGLTGF